MIAVVGLTFASKGGGGDKKKSPNFPFKTTFTPIRTANGFTLKTGPAYTGSYLLSQDKTPGYVSMNTITTFQKGNTIFVLPYKYKLTVSTPPPSLGLSGRNNLQAFDLKITMHK